MEATRRFLRFLGGFWRRFHPTLHPIPSDIASDDDNTPHAMPIYSPEAFFILAQREYGVSEDRTFRSLFGVSQDVCCLVWEWCWEHKRRPPRGLNPIHVLWALHFLKSYNTEDENATWAHTTRKTFRKWVWIVLRLTRKMKKSLVRARCVVEFQFLCL